MERGAVLGGTTGLLPGLAGLAYSGFVIAGESVLGVIMAGATIDSLMGGRRGMNSKSKKFENAIENGELLVLLDIPVDRIGDITQKND